MTGFFREEVIAARRHSWLGPVTLGTPLGSGPMVVLAVLVIAGIAAALAFGTHTRMLHAQGQLVPAAGLVAIKAPAVGVVTRIWVADGSRVKQGDQLLELDTDRSSAGGAESANEVSSLLRSQLLSLEQDRQNLQQTCELQQSSLQIKLASLSAQITRVNEELKLQHEQVVMDDSTLKRISPLVEKGYVSQLQVTEQAEQVARAKAAEADLSIKDLQLRQDVADTRLAVVQGPISCRTQLNTNTGQASEIKAQLFRNELDRAITIKAAGNGVVTNNTIFLGKTLAVGDHVADIEPSDAKLLAHLWLPDGGVGQVRPGQRVLLHYDAYPQAQYGKSWGTVCNVAHTPLTPGDYEHVTGNSGKTNMYGVLVMPDVQVVHFQGSNIALHAGEAFQADVIIGHEPILSSMLGVFFGTSPDTQSVHSDMANLKRCTDLQPGSAS
jgi:membrane fusion protein